MLSEHCSVLLASDSILEDETREEIRTLQDAISSGNSAPGQDVDKTNAALAQLEYWGNTQLKYPGVLSGLLRQSFWPECLEAIRESFDERSQFLNAVKCLHACIENIVGLVYTDKNAEESHTSFCDMISAFSEMSQEDQMASNTTVNKCFETMQVHSQAAAEDTWPLILESLELMTVSFGSAKQDAIIIFREWKVREAGMEDVLRRRTLSMEEVRNGLGTVALDSLIKNFVEQDLSLRKLRASTLKRHELVSSLMAMRTLLTYFISAPVLCARARVGHGFRRSSLFDQWCGVLT